MDLFSRAASWTALALAIVIGSATGAMVTVSAQRDVPFADVDCDLITVTALAVRHPDVRQFVVAATTDFSATSGTVEMAVRDDAGVWHCQLAPRAARFGRAGTRPLTDRRSGDGTTPAGVFPLGEVEAWDGQTFSIFGNRPDPGAIAPYRDVRTDDCWGATPGTSRYQHLVALRGCTGPDEWLSRIGDVYAHAAVIGANLDPISGDQPGEPAYAAAIFLHRDSYASDGTPKPTSGCVSLAYDDLVATIRILDPRLEPHFAIGPVDYLRATA